jgi:hypothetical protein
MLLLPDPVTRKLHDVLATHSPGTVDTGDPIG